MMQSGELEFSYEVDLTSLPRGERKARLRANEEERAKIAARLGVIAVRELSGDLSLTATKSELTVSGFLRAVLIRECVASLEEMTEEIGEEFDVVFLRQADSGAVAAAGAGDDENWEGEDVPPEVHEGESFDLGEFLVQQLALAMDPFPRAPGAKSLAETYGGAADVSPFAALKEKLEKSDGNQ